MTTVASPQQSKDLVASRQPAIVIASSGMATGGRVLHHLAAALPNPKNTVLFVGYQAAGTRGRRWCDGAKTVKMHGRDHPGGGARSNASIRCRRTPTPARSCAGSRASAAAAMTYLVHGEPVALEALRGAHHRTRSMAGAHRRISGTGRDLNQTRFDREDHA